MAAHPGAGGRTRQVAALAAAVVGAAAMATAAAPDPDDDQVGPYRPGQPARDDEAGGERR